MIMRDVVTLAKALSDENRVRILAMLRGRELCVCQVIELLELAPSTVSKHLAILKQVRLIEGRKDGRWMYYRLADDDAPDAAKALLQWTLHTLKGDKRLRDDAQRLEQILAMDPEVLCSQQRDRTAMESSACSSCAPATPAEARWPKPGRVT
jgi:ArsR family transcriptional regulator, arsenate/arsenite/antimonite-responsive transcriptional repressor